MVEHGYTCAVSSVGLGPGLGMQMCDQVSLAQLHLLICYDSWSSQVFPGLCPPVAGSLQMVVMDCIALEA